MVSDKFNDLSRDILSLSKPDALHLVENLGDIKDEPQRAIVCAALYQWREEFDHREKIKDQVKLALTSSPYVTENVQMEVARFQPFYSNTQPDWMLTMAKNPALTVQAQQAFSEHSHTDVKRALAENPSLTKELQREMLRDSYIGIKVSANPNLDPELAAEIADPDKEVWGAQVVASHYPLSEDLQKRIVDKFWDQDGAPDLHFGLAKNPHLTDELQIRLAGHPVTDVRWTLARNAGLTDAAASILAADPNPGVRSILKENPAVDVKDIEVQAHQTRDNLFSQLNIH